jgi:hypothetical protein
LDHGYPTPSLMVLVDTVKHSAGGGNLKLAQELVQLQIPGLGTCNEIIISYNPEVEITSGHSVYIDQMTAHSSVCVDIVSRRSLLQ